MHKRPDWLKACYDANFHVVFVPARYTDDLQPMDLSINKCFKDYIRQIFDSYLVDEMTKEHRKSGTFKLPTKMGLILKGKIVEWAAIAQAKIVLEDKAVKRGTLFLIFREITLQDLQQLVCC